MLLPNIYTKVTIYNINEVHKTAKDLGMGGISPLKSVRLLLLPNNSPLLTRSAMYVE